MKKITLGITAHVDSGKTTLAEAMLYLSGTIRKAGRVDHGSSALDTDAIERGRGITIFSHRAELRCGETDITLLDTPGHIDFTAETERTLNVIDYAVLVISGTDGVQSHTSTLWKLLKRYGVPVFIFVNKMDLAGAERDRVLSDIHERLSPACIDFTAAPDEIFEQCSMCDDELMERYLDCGTLTDDEIARSAASRRIFPVTFGSALKMEGIDELMSLIDRLTVMPAFSGEFGASVYKITYDERGNRLTHLKVTGGSLGVRDELEYTSSDGRAVTSKVNGIRLYNGDKFTAADTVDAGTVCAVTGLSGTYAGQGIGSAENSSAAAVEPVMTYTVVLPDEVSVHTAVSDLRQLQDEDPQLHICIGEDSERIQIQLMGAVQLEVLTERIHQKFGYRVSFGEGAVAYRETIADTVEGVGHYEPLRHYAEVHLILEPLERGSGLEFDTVCSEDRLDRNWQRLVLTHLAEKTHIGVLTGSPVTDMKITLAAGRSHIKHTEGGDFRQATYRAVRQGLRSAETILLEPYYDYELEVPTDIVGRAISDLQHMSADFSPPVTVGEMSVITGSAPVSELNGYQSEVIGYTKGRGKLICINSGYRECHNTDEVIKRIGYNCDGDVSNTADSVFCSHGSGTVVKWSDVPEYMHLPSVLAREPDETVVQSRERAERFIRNAVSDEELLAILERTYGKRREDIRRPFKKTHVSLSSDNKTHLPRYTGRDYLLVDGYNIIFAWDELKKIAKESLDSARAELINMMCSYAGYRDCELILVFDAYRVSGHHRDVEKYSNISIVYTKESETADTYIERTSHELSRDHRVHVATSDGAEQMIILGSGAMRISAEEFRKYYLSARKAIDDYINGTI